MPLVSSTIPNLINGVSQQPAALRLASQAEAVVNCMPSPVEGLKKRPPFNHIGKLFSGSAGSGRPHFTVVDRDGTNRWGILLQDNAIKVFGLDGVLKSVATPNGTSYLDVAGEPSKQFRVASVADYTFILNREKVPALLSGGGDLSPSWGTKGMVFVKAAAYNTEYKVKVNATEVAVKTRPPGGDTFSATYSQSGTTVTVTCNNHGWVTGYQINFASLTGTAVNGQFTITVTGANTFTFTAAQSLTTSGNCSVNYNPSLSTVDIAKRLRDALAAQGALSGFTFTADEYIIRVSKNDSGAYTMEATDGYDAASIRAVKGTVESLTDLPTKAEHGFIVKVQGDSSSEFDDWYLRFETNAGSGFGDGNWQETVAPGVPYKLDPATMPHVLVRENDGTFTFKQFDWSPKLAGDDNTAPNPSFVGSQLSNITVFRNRLVLLSDENVILSAADEFDRFFPETVQTVLDSDPIDITCGGSQVNVLVAAVPFASTLLLFSRHAQFRMDSGSLTVQPLTPKSASITQMTAFETLDGSDPVAVGRTIYFPIPRGTFGGLREYFLPDTTSPVPASDEVTATVPRYIPADLVQMAATVSEEAVALITKSQPKRLYFYKFFFQGDQKLQSAWSYWEVEGGKQLLGIQFVDSDLYAVVQYADGVYLEQVVVRPENVDPGKDYELLVDRKASQAACTVTLTNPSGLDVQSTITLPYPRSTGGEYVVVGTGGVGNPLAPGQVVFPIAQGANTITVRGNLTTASFWVGELYTMRYEFSTPYLKEQPQGGGVSIIGGPRLQMRTWTLMHDKSGHFELWITPRGRTTKKHPFNGLVMGDSAVALGTVAQQVGKFRVPVMAQNIDTKVEIFSRSPLPCRVQSAEWEGMYFSRADRL
jgi:hypothetical protein